MKNASMEIPDIVEIFAKGNARSLPPEDQEDFRQDVLVSLIEEFGPEFVGCTELDVFVRSTEVLVKFRAERRARTYSQILLDEEHLSISAPPPKLYLALDVKKALSCLPKELHNVAVDLFYNDLTQQEVANKYNRNQSWVSAAKKQIVQKVYSFLKEKKPCR